MGSLSLLQGIKPRSPTLKADSLPAEPQGKPKNTGVGSLSLLQGIFPTQELNQGLLHCRQILYQLSYQGSPNPFLTTKICMYIGEGNGTPLQYSCLENPMDGGAWWAAVHGVAKSWARLGDFPYFLLSCIGEGNGNPLQCSCLENPRDGGAWWAAIYGVA